MPNTFARLVEHECPRCKHQFFSDCMSAHEERFLNYAKAFVVTVGGLGITLDVVILLLFLVWGLSHQLTGLNAELVGWCLTGLFGFLGAIIYWAFPKREK